MNKSDTPYKAPPCSREPRMTGDAPASKPVLRRLAATVCPTCDPQSFHDCRAGMHSDDKWRVRAGVIRADTLL